MKFLHPKYLLILFLSLLSPAVKGQEVLTSVTGNPRIPAGIKSRSTAHTAGDTLVLPFLDDFSTSIPIPGQAAWDGSKVYINNHFGQNPPTYQVATLDMMDSTGRIYDQATVESFLADDLTSRPIDLYYPQDTSVYLSFYFQPGGFGDIPEPTDSLVVEMYAPGSNRWYRVWSRAGGAGGGFRIALINISESRFLQKGFRFRFRNYASLAPSYEPSLKVNADHWNLDYVYLNRNRHFQDTIMPDASLTQPIGNLLVSYTSMPWNHFNAVGISAVKTYFQLNINNLSVESRAFTPVFRIVPLEEGGTLFEKILTADEVRPFEKISYDEVFNYGFASTARDSARFEITLDMNQANPDWIPGNDKITRTQVFTNYYSYDDGTAEAGYGLVGEGTKRARLAYRFKTSNTADSLVAINYAFNQSFENAGKKYFMLAIWADDDNLPGTLLYSQEGAFPRYQGINDFQTITLDTALLVPSTYYIGWIQTSADFLNIGFDRQNDHREDILYNISGTWKTSGFEGSLMIRPVFANRSQKFGMKPIQSDPDSSSGIKIFPNPADDLLWVASDPDLAAVRISLINLQGMVVLETKETGTMARIPVGALRNGYYLVEVRSASGVLSRQKILILHE